MLTIDEIKKKKDEYGMTNAQLAMVSGVPLGTVQKVLGNVTKSPRLETVEALSKVFEEKPAPAYSVNPRPNIILAFNTHEYDRQGEYTIDDYLALPDEQRVELIDGVFYDMSAPTAYHQLIGGEIYAQIRNFIRANNGDCVAFVAPTDVQLNCDNRTMVQPDVMVICRRDKITHKRIFGSPDFVCEVLSPSTKAKDLMIKNYKYQEAGVREYWLIDPYRETVMVYDFRDGVDVKWYTFEDCIPLLIFDGALSIDMKDIREYLSFAAPADGQDY